MHWRTFLESLQGRGLVVTRMITSDDHAGLRAARRAVFPNLPWRILSLVGGTEAPMRRMTVTKAEETLVRTVERVAEEGERVALTRNGKPVAAIVTAGDLEFLEALEGRADLEAAREALKSGEFIPWEKVKADLGL